MARRRQMVRLGIPAVIVGVLAVIALWRVGAPARDENALGTIGSGAERPAPATRGTITEPLTRIADVLARSAVGRRASLENIEVRQLTSRTTFWAGSLGEQPVFVALDEDVRRVTPPLQPGERLTLIGEVRAAPQPAVAAREWRVSEATARDVASGGVYLHATEVRRPPT